MLSLKSSLIEKLETSLGFLIVISMVLFDLDFIDIGFPYTDVSWVNSVVMGPVVRNCLMFLLEGVLLSSGMHRSLIRTY